MFGMQSVNRRGWWVVALVLAALLVSGVAVTAQGPKPQTPSTALGTGFTYQGQLKQNGAPVNGTLSLAFRLYNAPSGGSALAAITQTLPITNGLFTTQLDYGNQFNGDERYLGIAVGSDPELTPRQRLSAVPYAMYARGNWGLNGNAGTTANNFVGTTDNMSLTLGVSGTAALRLVPITGAPIIIGGYSGNRVGGLSDGATIAGGGSDVFGPNIISGTNVSWSTIGGGVNNRILDNAFNSTIGGGYANVISGTQNGRSVIGGGYANIVTGNGATIAGGSNDAASDFAATVGGGDHNTASSSSATVGGGQYNTASGGAATVGGGDTNTASKGWATVGGGSNNTASGFLATVVGGDSNTASGSRATVGGGSDNTAGGNWSFAAGRNAKANQQGAFVWSDNNAYDFNSGGVNHFDVRATGGISLVTLIDGSGNPTAANVSIAAGSISFGAQTRQMLNLWTQAYGIGVQAFTEYFRTDDTFDWFHQGVHSDTRDDAGAGGTRVMRLDGSGNLHVLGTVSSGGADVAERIFTSDAPQPGDVVEIDPNHPGQFRLAGSANSSAVAGVVSTRPGVRLNMQEAGTDDGGVQLALVGRVPVKVSAENGAIRPGDLLVASGTPGHAMRASASPAPGTIIGKALGNLDDGTGVIEMLVMLR